MTYDRWKTAASPVPSQAPPKPPIKKSRPLADIIKDLDKLLEQARKR